MELSTHVEEAESGRQYEMSYYTARDLRDQRERAARIEEAICRAVATGNPINAPISDGLYVSAYPNGTHVIYHKAPEPRVDSESDEDRPDALDEEMLCEREMEQEIEHNEDRKPAAESTSESDSEGSDWWAYWGK